MKSFFKNYNLEFLSAFMFATTVIAAVLVPELSASRKILLVFMFLFTLHEWEENRFPGGFERIMEGMIGRQFDVESKKMSHIPVMILLIAIHIIPFAFDNVVMLVLIPVCLALFEGFVHTMGVKLSGAKKFYTPGMVTAYCMAAFAIFAIVYLNAHNITNGTDYLPAALCTWLCFAVMQNRVLAINGIRYRDLLGIIKSKIKK